MQKTGARGGDFTVLPLPLDWLELGTRNFGRFLVFDFVVTVAHVASMILCVFLCFVSVSAAVTEVSFPDKSLGIVLLPVTDSVCTATTWAGCTYLEIQFRNSISLPVHHRMTLRLIWTTRCSMRSWTR